MTAHGGIIGVGTGISWYPSYSRQNQTQQFICNKENEAQGELIMTNDPDFPS